MFCPSCGTQNEVRAANCLRCGGALPQPQSAKPSDASAATPTSGTIRSADAPSSSEEPLMSSSSSASEAPNDLGPAGQSPYSVAQQSYGVAQPGYGGGTPQGYGAPYAGGGQSAYGGQPGYASGTPYGGGAPAGGNVPNYMVWSIVSTVAALIGGILFIGCFIGLPMGIVAIVFSTQVNNKLRIGDYAGAVESSNKAKLWCIIASVVSAAGFILTFIFIFFFSVARFR